MHKVRDKEILERFGSNVKRIRLTKGKTQEELAEDAKISQVQIARIEKGRLNTSLCTIKRLIDALEIDANTIFDFHNLK